MRNLARVVTISGVALLFLSSIALFGCSSNPSAEEMKALNDLKAEISSLQNEISSKEQQASSLEKDIAGKNQTLKKCSDDQQVVKQRLAK